MHVIVGAGITGLVSAKILLKKKVCGSKIIILERGNSIGGLLSSIHYPDKGYFDYGIHTFYDTNISELNLLMRGILSENDWIFNKGVKRDYGGSYFNGILQSNSSYVDLRNLNRDIKEKCIISFFENFKTPKGHNEPENAQAFLSKKFGPYISQNILSPILEKVFFTPAHLLHPCATQILPLSRVVMFEENTMEELSVSPQLCDSLAYTNQLTIPPRLIPSKETYYPKQYGMIHVIDALKASLTQDGVKILTGVQINQLKINSNKFSELEIHANGENQIISSIEKLYWTCGVIQLAKLMNLNSEMEFDPPLKTFVVNMLLSAPDKLNGMFYAYCLDKDFLIHRVSSPYNLCKSSQRDNKFPFAAEIISKGDHNIADLAERTVYEAIKMGAIDSHPEWMATTQIPGGYPLLTCRNVSNLNSLRDSISNINLTNLAILGSMAKNNLFYQTDILADAYQTIMS